MAGGARDASKLARLSPSPVIKKSARAIPLDVLTEILLRVPAEHLVEFKCVCKEWHELIASQSFAVSHVDHWMSRPISGLVMDVDHCFGYDPSWTTNIFYLSNVDHDGSRPTRLRRFRVQDAGYSPPAETIRSKKLRVLVSCDGLILMGYAERNHCQLLICHPVTGSYRSLPVFRPAASTRHSGLWRFLDRDFYEWTMVRTAPTGQYKILVADNFPTSARKCYVLDLQIGNLKEHSNCHWKELEMPLPPGWSIKASTAKEGKVHWLAMARPGHLQFACNLESKVLSFDISNEDFSGSVSVKVFHELGRDHYFASKGTFYRTKCISKAELILSALDDFHTLTWTVYRTIRCGFIPNFLSLSGEHVAVLADGKSSMGFDDAMYLFHMIPKKFVSVGFESGSKVNVWANTVVPHINSLVGWV